MRAIVAKLTIQEHQKILLLSTCVKMQRKSLCNWLVVATKDYNMKHLQGVIVWRFALEVRYPHARGVSQRCLRDTIREQGKTRALPPLRCYLKRVLREMWGVPHTGPLRMRLVCLKTCSPVKGNPVNHFLSQRCPSTVSCAVPSGESPNFRWIPS